MADDFFAELNAQFEDEMPALFPDLIADAGTPIKAGPVVNRRKREGLQLCNVFNPAKPPKWKLAIFEPKFNGYRCSARIKDGKVQTLTSTQLPHWNTIYLIEDLEMAAAESSICNNIVIDGEITHKSLSFDEAGGILRTHEDDPRNEGFVMHTWDIFPVEEWDAKTCSKTLIERKKDLTAVMNKIKMVSDRFQEVEYRVGPISEIETHAREFVVEWGEEGIVAKDADGYCDFRKSSLWLKWKPKFEQGSVETTYEGDFKITGIKPGRGKASGMVGSILIEGYLCDDGNISPDRDSNSVLGGRLVTGRAGTGLDDPTRAALMTQFNEGKLIGSTVEIKYTLITPKNRVYFPVFYRMRPDKDEQGVA